MEFKLESKNTDEFLVLYPKGELDIRALSVIVYFPKASHKQSASTKLGRMFIDYHLRNRSV